MLMPIPNALKIMQTSGSLLPVERVPLAKAAGRVLREPLLAETDQPAFDRSAMDGFAVHRESDPKQLATWQVVRTVHAGDPAGPALRPGEAIALFTGAEVPQGASRIIPTENATREGIQITETGPANAPHYIRRRGDDCRAGEQLLAAPTRIGSPEIAILAQHGQVRPTVSRLPRVLHLTSGNELIDPAATPSGTQIRDTNAPLIEALLTRTCGGWRDLQQVRVPDQVEAFHAALDSADWTACDLLVISGGAAKGDRDLTRGVLETLGFEYGIAGIDMRPGKPFGFATSGSQLAVVIPGNPVSHWSVWHAMVAPMIERMMGLPSEAQTVVLPLNEDWQPGQDRRSLRWPGRLIQKEGRLTIQPLPLASSGDLSRLAGANVLIYHQPTGNPLKSGTKVEVQLLF